MVKNRREKGQQREREVVQAAARAIADRGLGNVRMSDVADLVGMSPGHISYYFGSKSELLMEAIKWSEDLFQREVTEQVARISDPWERLDRLIDVASAAEPGDTGWVLWFEVWSSASNDAAVARLHDELDQWWRTTMAGVIRYGQATGVFKEADPDSTTTLISALIDGLSIRLTLGTTGISRDSLLDLCHRASRLLLDPAC